MCSAGVTTATSTLEGVEPALQEIPGARDRSSDHETRGAERPQPRPQEVGEIGREHVECLARPALTLPRSYCDLSDVDAVFSVANQHCGARDPLLDRSAVEEQAVQRPLGRHQRAGAHDAPALEERRAEPGADRDPERSVVSLRGTRPPLAEEERLCVVQEPDLLGASESATASSPRRSIP